MSQELIERMSRLLISVMVSGIPEKRDDEDLKTLFKERYLSSECLKIGLCYSEKGKFTGRAFATFKH
jgi:hypothetical protein